MARQMRFDGMMAKAGIDEALRRLGIRQQLSSMIPSLAYFSILLILARKAGDGLSLDAIFSAYLPNILPRLCF